MTTMTLRRSRHQRQQQQQQQHGRRLVTAVMLSLIVAVVTVVMSVCLLVWSASKAARSSTQLLVTTPEGLLEAADAVKLFDGSAATNVDGTPAGNDRKKNSVQISAGSLPSMTRDGISATDAADAAKIELSSASSSALYSSTAAAASGDGRGDDGVGNGGHQKVRKQAGTSSVSQATTESQAVHATPFVSLCNIYVGRRIGNRLFQLSAALGVARSTGRQVVLPAAALHPDVDAAFDRLDDVVERIAGYDVICGGRSPCFRFTERLSMTYDRRVRDVTEDAEERSSSVLLCGYFQSWKYFHHIEQELRSFLRFRRNVTEAARNFLESARPTDWPEGSFARVGVHVRRGDFLDAVRVSLGYAVPDAGFYRRASRSFVHRHRRVQFVVASDDLDWTRRTLGGGGGAAAGGELGSEDSNSTRVTFVDVGARRPEVDLAVLASCRHGTIVSAGSFGWWAAWLANGLTIYYADWPRHRSKLRAEFSREDYYPPHWIPKY